VALKGPLEGEDEVEEVEVGVDVDGHDATLGTVTPFVSQSWSAKEIVARGNS